MHNLLQGHTFYRQTGWTWKLWESCALRLPRGRGARLALMGHGDKPGGQRWAPLPARAALSLQRCGALEAKSKDSVPRPEAWCKEHLYFGYGVLVWGYTASPLTMSHSWDSSTGRVFFTLMVFHLRKPAGRAVRMGRRDVSHHLLKSVCYLLTG